MRYVTGLLAGLVLVIGSAAVRADEEKVAVKDLPKAIVDAVKAKFPKAELVSGEKEKEDGKTVYEVKIKDGKTELEIKLTEEGKIVELEKEIAVKDLPKAVAEAVEAKYPKATVKEAEEVTKGEKTVYEVTVKTADGKTLEVALDPAGKILTTEEVKEKKKEEKK
ncbi:PepSY-like domain-containing protein [Zavarzinella formosa]|uniref:PepSY-like domain-containing protein n=1 Tax=Zavarzinella formosa TaxID=360055 RepID=UPI0003122705|nr:PepSY-like domain-containing protein [Zavarzinella formosa]